MYALKDVFPEQHLHYWQSFVLGCRLLCRPCINSIDLMITDCKLLHFLKEYEKTNGEVYITPNLHLHLQPQRVCGKLRQYLWILAVHLRKI